MAKKSDSRKSDQKKKKDTKKKAVPKPKAGKKPAVKGVKAAKKPPIAKKVAAKAKPVAKPPKKLEAKAPRKVQAKAPVLPAKAPKAVEKAPAAKVGRAVKGVPKPVETSEAPVESAEALRDLEGMEAAAEGSEEVVLTDAEGRRYCRVKDCDQLAAVDGYCRFHYLLYWKKIQIRKKILSEGKLERYIEELTARYPDKFLDMLRKDLRSEKEFLAAIQELEIDESAVDAEFEDESANYIDEVRGMGEAGAARDEEDF